MDKWSCQVPLLRSSFHILSTQSPLRVDFVERVGAFSRSSSFPRLRLHSDGVVDWVNARWTIAIYRGCEWKVGEEVRIVWAQDLCSAVGSIGITLSRSLSHPRAATRAVCKRSMLIPAYGGYQVSRSPKLYKMAKRSHRIKSKRMLAAAGGEGGGERIHM